MPSFAPNARLSCTLHREREVRCVNLEGIAAVESSNVDAQQPCAS